MNKIFIKNIGFNFLFTILTTLSTFILLRTLFAYFNYNQNDYGLWLIIFSILSYIYLMDFGISNGLRNIITPMVNSNRKLMNIYISSNYIIMLLFTFILLILVNFIMYFFPYELLYKINGFNINLNHFKIFISLVVNLQIFYFLVSSIKPIFHAFSKNYLVNVSQFLSNVLIIITLNITIYLKLNNDWILLAIVYLGTQTIIAMISIIIIRKYNIEFKFHKNKKEYIEILDLGYKFFFLQLSNLILFNSMNILVGIFVNLEESSKFQISYKLLSMYILIFNIISAPVWTLVITKWQENNVESIRNILQKLQNLILLISLPIIVTSLLLNHIVKLWMGKNFGIETPFSILMAVYIIFNIICVVLQGVLNGLNLIKIQIFGYIVGALILIVGVVLLNNFGVININKLIILGCTALIMPILTMIVSLNNFLRKEKKNGK